MKPIIITGTKRAGTTYVSSLITASGYWCSHERVFKCERKFRMNRSTIEASWVAAAFLKGLDAHIIHQVRHPLLVVVSLIARGDFKSHKHASIDWPRRICPDAFRSGDKQLALCLRFWLEWNRMVSKFSDHTWRFDDLRNERVAKVLSSYGRPVTADRVALGASVLPNRINTSMHKLNPLSWRDIPNTPLKREVIDDARRYGYDC